MFQLHRCCCCWCWCWPRVQHTVQQLLEVLQHQVQPYQQQEATTTTTFVLLVGTRLQQLWRRSMPQLVMTMVTLAAVTVVICAAAATPATPTIVGGAHPHECAPQVARPAQRRR